MAITMEIKITENTVEVKVSIREVEFFKDRFKTAKYSKTSKAYVLNKTKISMNKLDDLSRYLNSERFAQDCLKEDMLNAVGAGNTKAVYELVENGFDLSVPLVDDERNRTALFHALTSYDKEKMIELLLKLGASAEDRDNSGRTIIECAKDMSFVNEKIVAMLERSVLRSTERGYEQESLAL